MENTPSSSYPNKYSTSDVQPVFPAGSLLWVGMGGCLEHGNVITKASQDSRSQGS